MKENIRLTRPVRNRPICREKAAVAVHLRVTFCLSSWLMMIIRILSSPFHYLNMLVAGDRVKAIWTHNNSQLPKPYVYLNKQKKQGCDWTHRLHCDVSEGYCRAAGWGMERGAPDSVVQQTIITWSRPGGYEGCVVMCFNLEAQIWQWLETTGFISLIANIQIIVVIISQLTTVRGDRLTVVGCCDRIRGISQQEAHKHKNIPGANRQIKTKRQTDGCGWYWYDVLFKYRSHLQTNNMLNNLEG